MWMDVPLALGPALRDYQANTVRELLRGIRNCPGEIFTVMYPRQAGKNEVSAILVATLLHNHAQRGGSVIVCAPTLTPQGLISFERTRRILAMSGGAVDGPARSRHEGSTIRVGRASATYLSASPEAHVAGHTASLAIIADEAQDIEAEWFNRQFRPMAASTGAPTVMFGTPWSGHTLLEETVERNREADRRALQIERDPLLYHHQVSWQQVAEANARYGTYVRAEQGRLGASHPIFLTQYELVPAEAAGRLLSSEQLAKLRGEFARLRGPRVGDRYVAGCDLGGEGPNADATVITIGRLANGGRLEVVEHIAWEGARFTTVIAGIRELLVKWSIERMCADATGMGAPLVAQIAEGFGERVERFIFSDASKSQLGYDLVAALNTGRLAAYADDGSAASRAFAIELAACRSWLRGHSALRWEAPAGGHDDYVASLALCLRAAAMAPTSRVASGRRRRTN
jgi:hypothetical protein